MDKDSIKLYLSAVKKNLYCGKKHESALIEGLRQELLDFAEANPGYTFETLHDEFGSPQDVAMHLLESLDKGKIIRQTRSRQQVRFVAFAAVFLAIVVVLSFLLFKSTQLDPSKAEIFIDISEPYESEEETN